MDEKGKALKFNSMVDAMDFMGKNGWKFIHAYVVASSNQNVYHWLLEKSVKDDSEITKGFQTREQFKDQRKSENEQKNEKRAVDDGVYGYI